MTGSERKDHFQHQDDWVWGVCGQREREREGICLRKREIERYEKTDQKV